ncbi:interferon a3-like [Toxotes jaculatrix]|uniref:interferon a3-like n=1 Tax=Toxotes jaculatrix TaxID=941984 RepID=UPI001B3B02D4|nr:interferon a3-like [Toxotes jaculatrix]
MISWTGLFILCGVLNPALCCDWLRHYGHYSNISLTLIQLMGGELTEEESPVSFPYRLYRQIRNTEVESQLVFIRDGLELISGLYLHDNLSSVTWNTEKMTHFLMSLNRQIDGLNTCVSMNSTADNRLSGYYRRLKTRTLSHTGGSTASWELIRKETKLHLDQLDLLVASIKHSSAASRRRSTTTPHQQ